MSAASRKGQTFERLTANFLRVALDDDRIDIQVKRGTKDLGDIAGVRTIRGGRVVVEVKNHTSMKLAAWWQEAQLEQGNADADAAVLVHKRVGRGAAGHQWVTMDLATLAWLLQGGPTDFDPIVLQDPHTETVA